MNDLEEVLLMLAQFSKSSTEALYLKDRLEGHKDSAEKIARALGATEEQITEAIDKGVAEARRL